MFSCTVGVSGGTMTLNGDGSANNVAITDNGDGDLTVVCDSLTTSASNIVRIDLDTKGGNDDVSFTQNGNRTRNMDLNVKLGGGNDDFTGVLNGNINASRTLDIEVKGEGGADDIYMYATNDVDVSAGATLALNLSGGDGTDEVFADYRGEVDGTIRLKESGGDSGDWLYARVRADAGSSGRLRGIGTNDARVEGNSNSDTLQFYVYKQSTDSFSVAAKVDGGERPWWNPFESDTDTCYRTTNVDSTGCENDNVV
jgi:hypothetical protein